MALSDLQAIRQAKVEALRAQGIDPYPPRSFRTHTTVEAATRFDALEPDLAGAEDPETVTLAGRIVAVRPFGKIAFVPVRDGHGELQLFLRQNDLGVEAFNAFFEFFDLGDFIEATGHLMRSRTGELSLRVTELRMLAKALNAPPEKWHGLADIETRYRRRYVDLMASAETRRIFEIRGQTITAIRSFLDQRGYLEVETPALQPLYGGAAARPFTTVHYALDQTFYLRIADELYLKRLLVGGYERVYEICKDFRNEGIDRTHSPEFTMLEFYEAYADYRSIMDAAEALFVHVVTEVFGEPRFTSGGHEIDLTPPWTRVTLQDAIREHAGVDYLEHPDQQGLLTAAREVGADVPTGTVWPRIVDELLKQFVKPKLIQPTILYNYPVALSPLAKRSADDPSIAERFQVYFAGAELGNAFTELNDPMDQLARFRDQAKDREAGDTEAMPIDADFINALMYGMPPTGGIGIGIDRLVMVLTDQDSLRDVMLFPAMRNLPVSVDPVYLMLEEHERIEYDQVESGEARDSDALTSDSQSTH